MTTTTATAKQYPVTWSRGSKFFELDGENVAAADASLRLQRGRKASAHGAATVVDSDGNTFLVVFDDAYWENDGRGSTAHETVRNALHTVSRKSLTITAVFDADEDACLDVEDIDRESPLRDTSDFVRAFALFGAAPVWTSSSH